MTQKFDCQRTKKFVKIAGASTIAINTLLWLAPPSLAQIQGADPAAIAATTYCAARASGLNNEQASRQANQSMASAGNFATLIVHMNNIITRRDYLAKQQCPQYFGASPLEEYIKTPYNTTKQWDDEMCKKYPDLGRKYCNKEKPEEHITPRQNINNETSIPNPKAPISDTFKEAAHKKCLKAADYAGCMKFQISN